MPTRFALVILSATALAGIAGCVSREELRHQDEAVCSRSGLQAGTPDFESCLQREEHAPHFAYDSFGPTEGPADPGWYFGPGWPPRMTYDVW